MRLGGFWLSLRRVVFRGLMCAGECSLFLFLVWFFFGHCLGGRLVWLFYPAAPGALGGTVLQVSENFVVAFWAIQSDTIDIQASVWLN